MPFEAPLLTITERVDVLNARNRHHAAIPVLSRVLNDPMIGPIALVSSFGAESVVLLHMISIIDRATPVIFIDTEMLFAQTLVYQQVIASKFGLSDLRIIRAKPQAVRMRDPFGRLHLADPDSCCALRKTEPLSAALTGFDAWITGRKRFQAGSRARLALFENDADLRIKVNPLAHWDRADVADYIANNNLPRHPLVVRGYPSLGCAPCTGKVAPGEDARAGRWRNRAKTECGIHLAASGPTRIDAGRGERQ
jgi:phosphoadenosine phosphosulfate reductase